MCYMNREIRYPRLARGVIPEISFLKWMTSGKGTIQRSNLSSTRVSAIFLETGRNLIRIHYINRGNGGQVFLQYCYTQRQAAGITT
jgi:hypothetical protein